MCERKSQLKFSIITPSSKHGRFITVCIESVSAQSEVDFEHIAIDAGSTDETLKVLAKYPHLKWSSKSDDGINKGCRQSTGDSIRKPTI
jgi:glycosyltransferase involved in cell wall biosynthesis